MPYIQQHSRWQFEDAFDVTPATPGEFNYVVTRFAQKYLSLNGTSYQSFNDLIGALECCKLELYRRQIAPYEDIKIKENGDV